MWSQMHGNESTTAKAVYAGFIVVHLAIAITGLRALRHTPALRPAGHAEVG